HPEHPAEPPGHAACAGERGKRGFAGHLEIRIHGDILGRPASCRAGSDAGLDAIPPPMRTAAPSASSILWSLRVRTVTVHRCRTTLILKAAVPSVRHRASQSGM